MPVNEAYGWVEHRDLADDSYEPPADDTTRQAIREVASRVPVAWTPCLVAEEVRELRGIDVSEAAVRGVLVHGL